MVYAWQRASYYYFGFPGTPAVFAKFAASALSHLIFI
jgi:hypothetical protein